MLVWWGLWLVSIPALRGGYWACIASPLFVMGLILFVSGVPLQEKQAQQRWGQEPEYQAYRRSTFLLFPLPRCAHPSDRPEEGACCRVQGSADTLAGFPGCPQWGPRSA